MAIAACAPNDGKPPSTIPSAESEAALAPFKIIDAEFDARLAQLTHIDVVGCQVVIYDHGVPGIARLSAADTSISFFGRKGRGPGEFVHPRALIAAATGTVTIFDWVQRRMVSYLPDSTTRTLRPPYELARFGIIGRVIALPTGGFADLWAAETTPISYVPLEELKQRPLVARLDQSGQWTNEGWGKPRLPAQDSTVRLHLAMQAGDLAILGDTLYVLNSILADVQLFSLSKPSADPSRTIELMRHYAARPPWEDPKAQRPRGADTGRASVPKATFIADNIIKGIAVLPDGRIAVVALHDGLATQTAGRASPYHREVLDVYSRSGAHMRTYRLPTSVTNKMRVLSDGTIVLLAHKDGDRLTENSVLFFRIDAPSTAASCNWQSSVRPSR